LRSIKEFSLPKLVGRFGILIVDTFSTLIFFMLQGDSWVLTTTGAIFAVTKVWHWQQSFKAVDKLRRFLHRGAWLLMAVLSVYFLITLGLSITQTPPEEKIDQNTAVLEQAIAQSRIANVESLTKEQDLLLQQNNNLTERLLTLNQWSQAWGPIQAQLNANLSRLSVISEELNKIYEEQKLSNNKLETVNEKNNATILKFKAVKPIGAQNLIGRVMPKNWIDASIVILFFLIGVVMEITLALSSLAEEKRLYGENKENNAEKEEPEKEENVTPLVHGALVNLPPSKPTSESLAEFLETTEDQKEEEKKEEPASERKGYNSDEILAYIEAAYKNNRLKPDDEVANVYLTEKDCKNIREYLQSFKLRGKIIVEEINGAYVVRLDKENLKKFITLQCSIERV